MHYCPRVCPSCGYRNSFDLPKPTTFATIQESQGYCHDCWVLKMKKEEELRMTKEIYKVTWQIPEDGTLGDSAFKEKLFEKEEDASAWTDKLAEAYEVLGLKDWSDEKVCLSGARVY